MQEMTAEIVKSTHLPVTVKTRLGWDKAIPNDDFQFQRDAQALLEAIREHNSEAVIILLPVFVKVGDQLNITLIRWLKYLYKTKVRQLQQGQKCDNEF